jgi:cell division septation protein DedD
MSHSAVVTLIVAVVLVALAVVAVAVLGWRDPEASKRRVEALFRRPPRPPKTPGRDHYYRPYWS